MRLPVVLRKFITIDRQTNKALFHNEGMYTILFLINHDCIMNEYNQIHNWNWLCDLQLILYIIIIITIMY